MKSNKLGKNCVWPFTLLPNANVGRSVNALTAVGTDTLDLVVPGHNISSMLNDDFALELNIMMQLDTRKNQFQNQSKKNFFDENQIKITFTVTVIINKIQNMFILLVQTEN